jgi:two-component system, LuxR family, sensor kinase FixL
MSTVASRSEGRVRNAPPGRQHLPRPEAAPEPVPRTFRGSVSGELWFNLWRNLDFMAQLRFERLIAELSSSLAASAPKRLEALMPQWLGRLGEFLGIERVSLFRCHDPPQAPIRLKFAHTWGSSPRNAARTFVATESRYPYIMARVASGEMVRVERLDDLPPGAETDRANLARRGFHAVLAIPLLSDGRVFGLLALLEGRGRPWPEALVEQLRLLSGLLASVLARKAAQGVTRQAEALNDSTLRSLPGMTVVVDRRGMIVRHAGMRSHRTTDSPGPFPGIERGANYLEACRSAVAIRVEGAEALAAGLARVLSDAAPGFSTTCTRREEGGDISCHEVRVEPLARREGGAVIVHLDCTALRRAELESERRGAELAHVLRVATLGDLATTLAHEVSQPLTAILSNAQAARRMLDRPDPDLAEIRDILIDIGENDRRASEVILRMRTLIKKGEFALMPVDLNALVRDVIRFLGGNAQLRHATLGVELDPSIPQLRGDRVQLQQVVLNLLLNGLEAMAESPTRKRSVVIRTAMRHAGDAELAVCDSGDGIPSETFDRLFEPFYTTKPRGLGMGLSIARTIVEAHGGRIWAANNPGRGATVGFTLPAGREELQ